MSPATMQALLSLALGFAVAGLVANAYQLIADRPLSFRLFEHPVRARALAAVPLLTFAAPFIIMRNTIRGRRIEGRRAEFVALATIIAGLWSLMSGVTVVATLQALGMLA